MFLREKLSTNMKAKKKNSKTQASISPYSNSLSGSEDEVSSDEEALYEVIPRSTSWKSKDEEKGVHFLLPLKSDQGMLIQQKPTILGLCCVVEIEACSCN